jgi:DNA-binding response OmpR family regulator
MQPKPGRGRILLADDDEPFRTGVSKLLQRLGFACLAAPDTSTALSILREKEIDALVSDIHMPGNDGLELIEAVPQIRRGLPVILLTGQPEVQTAVKSVRLSVAAYLVKPPAIEELTALLDENIARFHRLQAVSANRARIEAWARELAALEEDLRRPSHEPQGQQGHYLRLTLNNMALQLADLARTTAETTLSGAGEDPGRAKLLQAVRQTIEVLESTRKNFKSKELGELRRRLATLLGEHPEKHDDSAPG